MTPEQERHLSNILGHIRDKVDEKYRRGQSEHGGDLWDHSSVWMVDNAIEEAADILVYLITLREMLVRREHDNP